MRDPEAVAEVLERLTSASLQIHQALNLNLLLEIAATESRALLRTDRAIVYQFLQPENGVVVAEAVGRAELSLKEQLTGDACLQNQWNKFYWQKNFQIMTTPKTVDLAAWEQEFLTRLQIHAALAVPIVLVERPSVSQSPVQVFSDWGLLILHQCHPSRDWHPLEIQVLKNLSMQVGLAIQQLTAMQAKSELLSANSEKAAHRQLEISQAKFAGILEIAEDAIITINSKQQITLFNRGAEKIFGYTAEEVLGQSVGLLLPERFAATHGQYVQHFRHTPAPSRRMGERREVWGRRKGGAEFPAEVSISKLEIAEEMFFTAILRDITERKQIEADLRQKSQRLATIIATQQDIAVNNLNLAEVMTLVVDRVQELTRASGAVIAMVEADELVYRAASRTAKQLVGMRLRLATSLSGHCITTGQILQCDDAETDPRVDLEACHQIGLRSMLVVPLWHEQVCIGVLKVFSAEKAAFNEQDTQSLQLMAGFLAATIRLASELNDKNALLEALQESEMRYRSVVTALAEGILLQQADGRIVACNESAERILGLSAQQINALTSLSDYWQTVYEDGSVFPPENDPAVVTLRTRQPQSQVVMGLRQPDGALIWISMNTQPLFHPGQAQSYAVVTSFADITLQKQAEAAIQHQVERERMIHAIAQHIRQSLDLGVILKTTVTDVRQFLQCDRVIIYQFNPNWSGIVVTESIASGQHSILNMEITDTYFVEKRGQVYQDKAIQATADIYTAGLSQCHIELLERLQVRAKLVVPIWQGETLWGLLVAHQCHTPRHWHPLESELLQQLATQVAIAIQQSELYQQVQILNTGLELQVQERTAQLQQSLAFEALLKRITDSVRDSLDEQKILESVVRELARGLRIKGCDTGIYNADQTTSTIAYEYVHGLTPIQGITFAIAEATHAEVYPFLLRGQICQFCDVASVSLRTEQHRLTVLACPIVDDQGVLGDLWLFKRSEDIFNPQEVRLIQQVATQCAIALRQSRLYNAAQAQVRELERLNQLKDDFLSTISHELRTPIASIKTATQLLDTCLQSKGMLGPESSLIQRSFQILYSECDREINLINDLLDLTRLDSGTEPLRLVAIHLQTWILHIAEPFISRAQHQQQRLEINVAETLPSIVTDISYLERVLTELLNNAFKYTPSGETISIHAEVMNSEESQSGSLLLIRVMNTGVEIPAAEHQQIFETFYRIPNNDPWKYGGTGLGLALVKKLIEQIGGTIAVESGNNCTCFTVRIAI